MFENFKKFIHKLNEITMLCIVMVLAFYASVIYTHIFNLNDEISLFLGYEVWTRDIFHYTFYRFWSYVPLVVFTVSICGIVKTLITGKCSFLKGLSFGDVIFINLITLIVFLVPLMIEGLILIGLVISFIAFIFYLLFLIVTRFNGACVAEVEKNEEANLFTKNNVSKAKNSVLSKKGKRYDSKRYSLEDYQDANK